MDFTTNWGWPQWTLLILILISVMIATSQHGNAKIERSGERKGQPERYNGFAAIVAAAIWIAILVCGGFFQ